MFLRRCRSSKRPRQPADGIPGSRDRARAVAPGRSAGPAGGNGARAIARSTDGGASRRARSAARHFTTERRDILDDFLPLFAASQSPPFGGQQFAGGEDFGYFAHRKRVRTRQSPSVPWSRSGGTGVSRAVGLPWRHGRPASRRLRTDVDRSPAILLPVVKSAVTSMDHEVEGASPSVLAGARSSVLERMVPRKRQYGLDCSPASLASTALRSRASVVHPRRRHAGHPTGEERRYLDNHAVGGESPPASGRGGVARDRAHGVSRETGAVRPFPVRRQRPERRFPAGRAGPLVNRRGLLVAGSVVKMTDTSALNRVVAGSIPAGRSMRP